jgi:hypothetical protein
MLIPIFIDTSDLAQEFSLSDKDIETMIDDTVTSVSLEYYRLWQKQASDNLKSTRGRYLDSLVYSDDGLMKASIILRDTDPLAMMIEEGASEFDMKSGFEKSSKKKFNKSGGWYLTIPMRYGTPSALGESEIFAGILPESIYSKVKSLDTNIDMGAGMRSEGLKFEDIPKEHQGKTVRQAIPKSSLLQARKEYVSKSSKYEGMVKIKDKSTGQNSYMKFRRVSSNSDPSSWIHKGFEQRNFAEKAMTELDIESLVDRQIDNFLASYLS